MKYQFLVVGVAALAALTSFGVADAKPDNTPTQQKPCAELSGKARTNCLNAELKRGLRESEAARRKSARLDKAMKVACGADKAAPVAANAAAKGGALAYKGGRAVGDKLTGQKPCG